MLRRAFFAHVLGFAMLLGAVPGHCTMTGLLERPADQGGGVGIETVQGGVFSDIPGASILSPLSVFIDGVFAIEVPCCSSRGDVRAVYPQAPIRSGFSGVYNFGLLESVAPPVGNTHRMDVIARSTAGETLTMSAIFNAVRFGPYPFSLSARGVPPRGGRSPPAREPQTGNAGIALNNIGFIPNPNVGPP